MAREDVEIIRRAFEALSDGEATIWFRVCDPDVRVYPRPDEPDAADEYRGLDGLLEYFENWFGQWDEYEVELVEFTAAGEYVLVRLRERGRMEQTGIEVVDVFSHSFVLRGGKVVEWHMYDSHADALQAVQQREEVEG